MYKHEGVFINKTRYCSGFVKIRCLHHGGVWLYHVSAFVFGNSPNFSQACESS